MGKSILVDTGFWYALFDRKDHGDNHETASTAYELFKAHNILVPWPSLYETLNTRFVKNRIILNTFEKILKGKQSILICDNDYKERALETTIHNNFLYFSLVDAVIREMLMDRKLRIDYLASFNPKDFKDICDKREIDII